MNEQDRAVIKKEFKKVLVTFDSRKEDKTVQQLVEDISDFIKKKSSVYSEKDVMKVLKFLTHPDKLEKQNPKIFKFQEKYIKDSSGLFAVIETARLYKKIEEGSWESLLAELKEELERTSSVAGQQILKAQIALLGLIIGFDQDAERNLGKEYVDILELVPAATTVLMAAMTPYLTSFILINNVVQQILYHNKPVGEGTIKTLHRTFLSLSTLLTVSGNIAGLGLCYLNVFLADWMLNIIISAYNSLTSPLKLMSGSSQALVKYTGREMANTNLSMIFKTHEFTLVASILYKYINEQRSAMFPSLWTGTTKAGIMLKYLKKLSSIDCSDDLLVDKLEKALCLTVTFLEEDPTISGSGSGAMKAVNQVKELLSHNIKAASRLESTEPTPSIETC